MSPDKIKNILVLFLLISFSCSTAKHHSTALNYSTFESKESHLYAGNTFIFNADNTYEYFEHGPSVYFSKGIWSLNVSEKKISFVASNSHEKTRFQQRIDTIWVDISKEYATLLSKKKIVFEDIIYYRKDPTHK